MSQYLVAMSGFPSSGKSTAAKYLERKKNFERISIDNIRYYLFGIVDFNFYEKYDPLFTLKEQLSYGYLNMEKHNALNRGKSVVIDTSAPTEYARQSILSTNAEYSDLEKYVMVIESDDDILRQRNIARHRSNDPTSEWKRIWEEPKENNYTLLRYQNNTQQDLERMLCSIDNIFEKQVRYQAEPIQIAT